MKQRIISGIVAILLLVLLLVLGGIPMYIGVLLISLQAYRELVNLRVFKDVPLFLKILGAIITLVLIFTSFNDGSFLFGLSFKALSVLSLVIITPSIFVKEYKIMDSLLLYGCITFISLAFSCFVLVIDYSRLMFIYLIIITILTDTFAMVFGMLIGKHKLIPDVSPKKTVEGSIGGSLIATIIASIFYINLIGNVKFYAIIPITLLLSVVGQVGDLLFSKIKRENEIKDYSNIIPGHGGILDRLDSIILVVIAYVLFFTIL